MTGRSCQQERLFDVCYSCTSARRTALRVKLFEYNIFHPAYLIEYDTFWMLIIILDLTY